jgi:tyrosine-protein phosphatase SIW14
MVYRRLAVAVMAIGVASAQTNVPGVANFHQVNDHVYRGAQPTVQGFQNLANLGVKTVIDLREAGDQTAWEHHAVESSAMRYISIPFRGMSAPTPANMAKVLAIFDDPSAGPVFVHCRRGKDRTGTVIACYRISHDGWNNQKALAEARSYGMRWTEVAMRRYVERYRAAVVTAKTPAN